PAAFAARNHNRLPRAPVVFPSVKLQRMKSALTTAFVLAACVSFAQAPAPRADLVRTTLPLEGAPKAIPGPYKVMSEPALGSAGHVVFRPEDLGRFPGKYNLPVMEWGDGGCAIYSLRFSGFFWDI